MDIKPDMVKKYAPHIYFDEKEPFYPVYTGYTVFDKTSDSPSFGRRINICKPDIQYAIEYAIYWDFDITHLYEMEHVWVYVDRNGAVADCEASFHGRYLKGLKRDRSNIEDGTHVRLFSQPGKHAFSPDEELFWLIPDMESCTQEGAGSDGLIVTDLYRNRYETSEEINKMVEKYMQRFRFKPSMKFVRYELESSKFMSWGELDIKIPELVRLKLEEIKKSITMG